MLRRTLTAAALLVALTVRGESGDPQVKTDHPWYPGELAFSTFERLFKTQSALYKRVTGRDTNTDEDKALASWYFRNLYISHSTDAVCDAFGTGFEKSDINREYWTGLFAFGYSLCFTTHAQWCGEMEYLLGHTRCRATGVPGHTSFEVFLTGGAYGEGKWVLLDHDVSTVIFHEDGSRLLSTKEVAAELPKYSNPQFKPERQRGWLVGGLHRSDPGVYKSLNTAQYHFGYAGPPPMVRLRAGESLRRYVWPGQDNKTYVFWGYNFNTNGIPGPDRAQSWVNQPEKMYKATKPTPYAPGTARHGNASFTYKPDFTSDKYKEGVVDESDKHVTFEHSSPYIIGATPADVKESKPKPFGIYDSGAKNGLVIKGKIACPVKVSLDHGKTWKDAGSGSDGLDLTDIVKGSYQYWLKLEASPKSLADSGLTIVTVCQCGQTVMPRLQDGKNQITFQAGGTAVVSAGPTMALAEAHLVDGKHGSKTVTLELAAPRGENAVALYANAHVASGNPPSPDVAYQIEYSTDAGKTWQPVVKDWKILRRGDEPAQFWSQSMCFGTVPLKDVTGPVRVRFSNSGGKNYVRTEAHLVYKTSKSAPVDVTFAWKEGGGEVKTASHTYSGEYGKEDATWTLETGKGVETVWVEYSSK
ncbi:MAG TPA: hypothetical protein VEJ63_19165 [Planctomycetota bacterium]|nr:hypothetical protein [Planctomycetota bacterium]